MTAINYTGPDPSVECAYPPCSNRLRLVEGWGPQWCSPEHRDTDQEAWEQVCDSDHYVATDAEVSLVMLDSDSASNCTLACATCATETLTAWLHRTDEADDTEGWEVRRLPGASARRATTTTSEDA